MNDDLHHCENLFYSQKLIFVTPASNHVEVSFKEMIDIMRRERLVPSLLVFGFGPPSPVIKKVIANQKEVMAAIALACSDMTAVSADLRISRPIRYKLPALT